MLVELRREFDEIARHAGARQRRIDLVREQPVQRMAEFVEHRRHVVRADQRGLAGGGLGEIGDVVDHRLGAEQLGLADEVRHPRAARLVVALEVVEIHQPELGAVLVVDGVGHHVGLVDGDVGTALEGQPVHLVGGVEHALLEHGVQLEIGLHLGLVEIVFRLADLLGIQLPVPWLHLETLAVLGDHLLDLGGLALLLGGGRRHQLLHEGDRGLGRLGHLILEHIGRPARIAEQRRLLRAQLRRSGRSSRGCRWRRPFRRASSCWRTAPGASCGRSAMRARAAASCSAAAGRACRRACDPWRPPRPRRSRRHRARRAWPCRRRPARPPWWRRAASAGTPSRASRAAC